jgi:succinate dehydrogenase / fumarate reductase cytochrome b subunit
VYKPREGQWAWMFHRISGVAIFLFLFGHILSTSTLVWGVNGPEWHHRIDSIYRLPIFSVMHLALFAAVLYHAVNGIRVIIVDWWAHSTKAQKPLFYAEMVLVGLLLIFAVFKMVIPELKDYAEAKASVSVPVGVSATQEGGLR